MTVPVVDLGLLIRNAQGDTAFVQEIVGMCAEQAEQQIKILRGLCIDGESDAWRVAAHALKGTAANLGAEGLRILSEVAQKDMVNATAAARSAQVAAMQEKFADIQQALIEQGYLRT